LKIAVPLSPHIDQQLEGIELTPAMERKLLRELSEKAFGSRMRQAADSAIQFRVKKSSDDASELLTRPPPNNAVPRMLGTRERDGSFKSDMYSISTRSALVSFLFYFLKQQQQKIPQPKLNSTI
jgi:hypothetical protein